MPVNSDRQITESEVESRKICGLIMPISATTGHDKGHWDAMLELLQRAIDRAGYIARPVWTNSSTDRVSERIIGNIFEHPIVVADITDLNPNVMFELGLRLASKKPTLVVMEVGGVIPFDIRDFHIHLYPKNMSILGMEKFLNDLSDDISNKEVAFEKGEYKSFLSKVVVDVVSPNEREVSINQFLLDQLEEINSKLVRMSGVIPNAENERAESPFDLIVSITRDRNIAQFAQIDLNRVDEFIKEAAISSDSVEEIHRDHQRAHFAIARKGISLNEMKRFESSVRKVIHQYSGVDHVPRYVSDRFSF